MPALCTPSVVIEVDQACNIIINPFKPELTIVILVHYKPRIAVAILDL